MNHQSKATITAMGTYVPDRILSNADLEKWSIQVMNGLYSEQA